MTHTQLHMTAFRNVQYVIHARCGGEQLMECGRSTRAQRTRERLRAAAHRLFLRQGYLATSVDAILAEAGISSKETLYRKYANKEALFADS